MSLKETPAGNRVERKKEETKLKIVAMAMKLFKEQGVDGTTMEEIAEKVDIAKGTLYNYFPVKEAIIDEYIKRSSREENFQRILRLTNLPDTRSRMILSFRELVKGVQEQKEIFEKYLVYQMKNTISLQKEETEKSGIELLAGEIIRLGQKTGEIRMDLPKGMMEDLFVFTFIEVAKQFYMGAEQFNDLETIEQCVDLFINGVKVKKEEALCKVSEAD